MQGSPPDFAETYDQHVWDVYGYFRYRLGAKEPAEDLTQQTFERALRAWDGYDPRRASAKAWLLTIAHNLLVDHYRRRGVVNEEPLAEPHDPDRVPADEDEPSIGIDPELEAALGGLGQRERELIALRFGGDLSGREIAELTGLSLANVQQILSRSLRRLRDELDSDAPT